MPRCGRIISSGLVNVKIKKVAEGASSDQGCRLIVSGDDNILDLIKTKMVNDRLEISFQPGIYSLSERPEVTVFMRDNELEEIITSGSGDIGMDPSQKSLLRLKKLNVKRSGSGSIDLDVDVDELEVALNGSGNAKFRGKAREFKAKLSGSGNIKSQSLDASNVHILVNGSGNASVAPCTSLSARLLGSGNIFYRVGCGRAALVSSYVSKRGSGKIKRI